MTTAYHPFSVGLAAIAGAQAPIFIMVDGLALIIDNSFILFSE